MTELDKRLEQQQRAAGHANAADEKLDLFLKRRANLFNLGAPLFSAYPSIDTRPADYVGDRVRVRLSAFLQAGSTQRFPPCSTRVRRCRRGCVQRSCTTASQGGGRARTRASSTSSESTGGRDLRGVASEPTRERRTSRI